MVILESGIDFIAFGSFPVGRVHPLEVGAEVLVGSQSPSPSVEIRHVAVDGLTIAVGEAVGKQFVAIAVLRTVADISVGSDG